MLNTWLRNYGSILAFMKKEIMDTKRERKENALRAVKQFSIGLL